MAYSYRIVNVFTVDGDRLSGNPLAVFDDARGLDDATMQALARQLNLSETTFVLPSDHADARVRIFTPSFEMPFAGHPTLGTASVVAAGRDRLVLEMKAGLVSVTRGADGDWTLRAARAPVTRPAGATRAELASMVGLPADAICAEPLWVSTGVEQLVVPIASPALVREARPVPALIERWGYSPAREEAAVYLWARGEPHWTVRYFFTSAGAVIEDPATGSACANLGGWWLATDGALPLTAELRQGEQIERRSRLRLEVAADRAIYVTGAAIELGRGSFEL